MVFLNVWETLVFSYVLITWVIVVDFALAKWVFVWADLFLVHVFAFEHWSYLLLRTLQKLVYLTLSLMLNWVIPPLNTRWIYRELPTWARSTLVGNLNPWLWSAWAWTWCSNLLNFTFDFTLEISTLNVFILNVTLICCIKSCILSKIVVSSLIIVTLWSLLWDVLILIKTKLLMRVSISIRIEKTVLWLLLLSKWMVIIVFLPSLLSLVLLVHKLLFLLKLFYLTLVLFKVLSLVVLTWAHIWIGWVLSSLMKGVCLLFRVLFFLEGVRCLISEIIFFGVVLRHEVVHLADICLLQWLLLGFLNLAVIDTLEHLLIVLLTQFDLRGIRQIMSIVWWNRSFTHLQL